MPARKKAAKKAPARKATRKRATKRNARATGQTAQVQAKKKAVLRSLARGASVTAATSAAGMGRSTFYDLLATDPAFSDQVEAAQGKAIRDVEAAMFRRAKSMTYPGAVTAGIFLLKNKLPDDYRDVQDHRIHPGAGVDRVDTLKQLVESGERGKATSASRKADS